MTTRERFVNIFNFKSVDRLPASEMVKWWNKTIHSWRSEGLPATLDDEGLFDYWGLDHHLQFTILTSDYFEMGEYQLPDIDAYIRNEEDYEKILHTLYPREYLEDTGVLDTLREKKAAHEAGDFVLWFSIEGAFWWPRVLLGIEPHLYSFYDQPELYKRILGDLAEYHLKIIEDFCETDTPDFMSFYEDMSYNLGPMLSEAMFNEFLRPYYEKIVPALHARGIKVFVDTDGDLMPLIPWLLGCGVDGVLPLERQAGVDVNLIREKYPELLMIGGFDKTVMRHGEAAMRKEFDRLIPAMKSGGYIPNVDHQTPPDVSMENYAIYRRLQDEYCGKYHQ